MAEDQEWLTFRGTAEQSGDVYKLKADGGEIEVSSGDVKVKGADVQIRKGAPAQRVSLGSSPRPSTFQADSRDSSTLLANCPSGKTYCIGLVEFCCDNDESIGACVGVWDCG